MNPHITERNLVHSLGISPQTVICQLHNALGTKRYHLRSVTYRLNDNAKGVSQRVTRYQSSRLVHPSYSPDLSQRDFFLFAYLREKLKETNFGTPEQLEEALARTMEDIPRVVLVDVVESWRRRLERCIERNGNHFEYAVYNCPNKSKFQWKEVG
jgi:hypothetical protein